MHKDDSSCGLVVGPQVRGYEELEAQLDDAIVRTGMNEGGEGQDTQSSDLLSKNIVSGTESG